jgi:DNA polymerase
MKVVRLAHPTDFEGWRAGARALREAGVPPRQAAFVIGAGTSLFDDGPPPPAGDPAFSVPRAFVDLATGVIQHRDPDRFDLMYRVLWRLKAEPDLMHVLSDPDVVAMTELAKNVSRASHKMKAFVRFREIEDDEGERYVAWFEPAHHVVEATAPFFARRFANMRFSILTPELCAHWDGERLSFTPGATRDQAPDGDELEAFWKTYYASTFNPARLKLKTMQGEMPKRYWKNLPEASLIPELTAAAAVRTDAMVTSPHTEPARHTAKAIHRRNRDGSYEEGFTPSSVAEVWPAVQACRRCDLWRNATQGVAGEGPARARLMFVGEQPGDQEDLAGKPFIGPAGQLFDRALAEAGVPRAEAYVTNAVKHFKHEPRGKRRIHAKPNTSEIDACRWWLDSERRLVRPKVIVALGATAGRSVLRRAVKINAERGQPLALDADATALITVHPSYLLRLPDPDDKARAYALFVQDLAAAWRLAA